MSKVLKLQNANKEIDRIHKQFDNADRGKHLSITEALTSGGMGTIYDVYDNSIKRRVAMKVLNEDMKGQGDIAEQFIEEARITGQLEHPNIVPVHALGVNQKDELYFTMKMVEGETLTDILRNIDDNIEGYADYYTQFNLLTIFRKVCDAVSYAHSKGIVHRDIKPENIMVADYGVVMLMDWGIAKLLNHEDSQIESQRQVEDFTATLYGVIKGSPAYMSPEQASAGESTYDERSDIFLLGATLYQIITGQPPYVHDDVEVVLDRAENADVTPPNLLVPERQISDELSDIIMKSMAHKKDERYQSVEDFNNAIGQLMAGQIMSTRKVFKAGESIIECGDSGSEAYVIVEGMVEVYKRIGGKKTTFTRLGPGEVFGEMAAITDSIRSASVDALIETTCLVITSNTLEEQLHKMPPWFEKIVTALTKRLRSMDEIAHPLLISDCTFEVCTQLKMIFMCYARINDDKKLQHSMNDIVMEISNNLKIPTTRVRPIIAGLSEIGLAEIDQHLNLIIPNWTLFSDFVEYSKSVPNLSATSTMTLVSMMDVHKLYTDGASVVHRHIAVRPDEKIPPLGPLKTIKNKIPKEEEVVYRRNFGQKLEELQKYSSTAENANKAMFQSNVNNSHIDAKAPSISTNFK